MAPRKAVTNFDVADKNKVGLPGRGEWSERTPESGYTGVAHSTMVSFGKTQQNIVSGMTEFSVQYMLQCVCTVLYHAVPFISYCSVLQHTQYTFSQRHSDSHHDLFVS